VKPLHSINRTELRDSDFFSENGTVLISDPKLSKHNTHRKNRMRTHLLLPDVEFCVLSMDINYFMILCMQSVADNFSQLQGSWEEMTHFMGNGPGKKFQKKF